MIPLFSHTLPSVVQKNSEILFTDVDKVKYDGLMKHGNGSIWGEKAMNF